MKPRCLLCEDPSEDRHHLTATDERGAYLDPELRAPLCHDHHELASDDLHTVGTPAGSRSTTFLGSLELRLTRTAAFLGRVADAAPEPFASFLALLALHLARCCTRRSVHSTRMRRGGR
jgi:hypothetical protein